MEKRWSWCPHFYLLVLILINVQYAHGQQIADGIPYQTVIRNSTGIPLINQFVHIKSAIYSDSITGKLQWEEVFAESTNQQGFLKLTIGKGASTGNGLSGSFSAIN